MRDLRELDDKESYGLKRVIINLPDICYIGEGDIDPAANGCFELIYNGAELHIIASSGMGWDHVSVSLVHRCPTWDEMEYIAKLFFKPDEAAMQLHLPAKDHINCHPYTLHWWRPHSKLKKIPLPPKRLV